MTFDDSDQCFSATAKNAKPVDGCNGIMGTGRVEPAPGPRISRYQKLISFNQCDETGFDHAGLFSECDEAVC
jgi:hypothetical protein